MIDQLVTRHAANEDEHQAGHEQSDGARAHRAAAIGRDPDGEGEDQQDDDHDEVRDRLQGTHALLRERELVGAQQHDPAGVRPELGVDAIGDAGVVGERGVGALDDAGVPAHLLQDLAQVERHVAAARSQGAAVVLDEGDQPAIGLPRWRGARPAAPAGARAHAP